MNLPDAARATMAVEVVQRVKSALGGHEAWVVGGAVRDAVLGKEVDDLDLAVEGSPEESARRVAAALGGFAFELSSEFPTWRARDR
ncbi:MAG: hypothetical protein ACSLFD_01140, partial [Solirubrobacterales bacterium]